MKRTLPLATALIIFLATAVSAQAAVPGLMSYQGRLTTSAGIPVADGHSS